MISLSKRTIIPSPVPCLQPFLTQVRSLGGENPLEVGRATYSSVLAWRIPWTGAPGGLQSRGHRESDTTERLSRVRTLAPDAQGGLSDRHTVFHLLLDLNQPFDETCISPSWSSVPGTGLHHVGPASSS